MAAAGTARSGKTDRTREAFPVNEVCSGGTPITKSSVHHEGSDDSAACDKEDGPGEIELSPSRDFCPKITFEVRVTMAEECD